MRLFPDDRPDMREQPELSIVIPSLNTADLTAACVASIRAHATVYTEVIIVDGGSEDDTVEQVERAADTERDGLILGWVFPGRNLGFAGASNAGAAVATGRILCFLNSDTIVTPGWDTNLTAALKSAPGAIGAAGPMTNYAGGRQRDPMATYADMGAMLEYAAKRRAKHAHRLVDVEVLMGFCIAIPRFVWDQVGEFDERFFPGNFDDNDWCLRARKAGYRLVIASGAFIHHWGGRTFAANNIDWHRAMTVNGARFREKHALAMGAA